MDFGSVGKRLWTDDSHDSLGILLISVVSTKSVTLSLCTTWKPFCHFRLDEDYTAEYEMKNQGETMTCREANAMDQCQFIAEPKLDS